VLVVNVLTIVSPVVAALALVISVLSWMDGKRRARLSEHYGLLATADRMLGENTQLLRFHGIDPDTIELEYGVSGTDLSYLLQAFNAGSISYKFAHGDNPRVKAFPEGSYWYGILEHDATQRAFPLLRMLFDSKNPYIAACAATIRVIRTGDGPV
jgi:hypothetical protein